MALYPSCFQNWFEDVSNKKNTDNQYIQRRGRRSDSGLEAKDMRATSLLGTFKTLLNPQRTR